MSLALLYIKLPLYLPSIFISSLQCYFSAVKVSGIETGFRKAVGFPSLDAVRTGWDEILNKRISSSLLWAGLFELETSRGPFSLNYSLNLPRIILVQTVWQG